MCGVQALAWCPFQANLLASGGGTADRCIKTWNTHTGAMLHSVDTKSQVALMLAIPILHYWQACINSSDIVSEKINDIFQPHHLLEVVIQQHAHTTC